MKKKIIICLFSVLIIATAIYSIASAVVTYNYEIKNDDILVGLGAAITIIIGAFFELYELDLFYTVYYFFIKPKTVINTALNILSNLCLVCIFTYVYLSKKSLI